MGATSWQLDIEVPQLAGYDGNNQGDYPTVQLLSNTGQPVKILGGVSEAFATRDPGHSHRRLGLPLERQYRHRGRKPAGSGLVDVFNGAEPHRNVIFRIVDQSGNVVKAETLVSESPNYSGNAEMWHGAGSTANGFAIRYKSGNGPVVVRLFDNAGSPTTGDLDLATLTGFPRREVADEAMAPDSTATARTRTWPCAPRDRMPGSPSSTPTAPCVTPKAVATDLTLASVDRVDAAIDADGNVIVVFSAKYDTENLEPLDHWDVASARRARRPRHVLREREGTARSQHRCRQRAAGGVAGGPGGRRLGEFERP
jgi:hypothetical protein